MKKQDENVNTLYYYERDIDGVPIVTVCLVVDSKGKTARGVAYCSPRDNAKKSVGRGIALNRALGSLKREGHIAYDRMGEPKGEFNPAFSAREKILLTKKGLTF
jgi:hypothetical protein